jgi:hypothetical protein
MADWNKRLLLARRETTYGTSAAPTGADAILVSDLEVKPLEVDLKDRELIIPYFGNTEKVVSMRMVEVTFSVELAGSGTAGTAPRYGSCLRACAMNETIVATTSVTYAPVSELIDSVTLDFYADGTRHLITGARGTWSMEGEVGEIPKIEFEFTGIYNAPGALVTPSATFAAQADPVVMNSENTTAVEVHGFAARLESFSLELSNEVVYRQLAGATREVRITNRKPEGEVQIEAPAIGTYDYFAAVSAQTLGTMEFQHGQVAGNIVTFAAPAVNLGSPSYEDSDGVLMLSLPFMPNPTTGGNNEFTLAYT